MAAMADQDLLGNLISLRTMERQVGARLRDDEEVQPPKSLPPKSGLSWWRKWSTREQCKPEQVRVVEKPQGRNHDRPRRVTLADGRTRFSV
jgi:hypothetical protein